jgi:hypothetical protein
MSVRALAELMAQAQSYADFSMRKIGQVPPTLIAESPKRPIHFIPSSLADERAKNDFANTSRLVCIAYDVTAAGLVLESWMKMAKPDQPLDPAEPPSEAIDRQEVVVLLGETVGGGPLFWPFLSIALGLIGLAVGWWVHAEFRSDKQ